MENTNELLYTAVETSKILKIGKDKVYDLNRKGLLPGLNLGGLKITRKTIIEFLDKYTGYDLSDLNDIKPMTNQMA